MTRGRGGRRSRALCAPRRRRPQARATRAAAPRHSAPSRATARPRRRPLGDDATTTIERNTRRAAAAAARTTGRSRLTPPSPHRCRAAAPPPRGRSSGLYDVARRSQVGEPAYELHKVSDSSHTVEYCAVLGKIVFFTDRKGIKFVLTDSHKVAHNPFFCCCCDPRRDTHERRAGQRVCGGSEIQLSRERLSGAAVGSGGRARRRRAGAAVRSSRGGGGGRVSTTARRRCASHNARDRAAIARSHSPRQRSSGETRTLTARARSIQFIARNLMQVHKLLELTDVDAELRGLEVRSSS